MRRNITDDRGALDGASAERPLRGKGGEMIRVVVPVLASLWLAVVGCSTQSERSEHQHATASPASEAPVLFDNLGTYAPQVTTSSGRAQAYFDQGLRLTYGFNHWEAQRAFKEAVRLDPNCAMCYWGVALTYGSNYNSPTDADRERGAYEAIQAAVALSDRVTPRERAMIQALAQRHSSKPDADRAALDRAYADAMRAVTRQFPDDPDAATLFADALMNLRPWNLWTEDGRPQPGTEEIVQTLERVLAASPNHPGANHLYIHAVEASPAPERALPAADRLGRLMPGAGHIVHMPSHIYFRVGRYAEATDVNVRAVAVDRAYFARSQPSPSYRMMYFPHNLDFVWHSAGMEGRRADTLRAAREFAGEVPEAMARQMSDLETAPAAPYFALARFGRWEEILAQPTPPADLPYVTGAWRYTRGLAYAATGRLDEADRELTELRAVMDSVSPERTLAGSFKTKEVLRLSTLVLTGDIAARRGDTTAAVAHLTEAVRIQDTHWFTEPPVWYLPPRQPLGFVLLKAGKPVEAESAYREDLWRNRENGWSLYGLGQSLRAQGKTAEADVVDARFRKAWARADVKLTDSGF
jgi:tetratricopeptide (TPR) repeat protein